MFRGVREMSSPYNGVTRCGSMYPEVTRYGSYDNAACIVVTTCDSMYRGVTVGMHVSCGSDMG